MLYLVLIELNERKILIYGLEVPVLQLRATNKLRSGCRPNGVYSLIFDAGTCQCRRNILGNWV